MPTTEELIQQHKDSLQVKEPIQQAEQPTQQVGLPTTAGLIKRHKDELALKGLEKPTNILERGAKMLSDSATNIKNYMGLPSTEETAQKALSALTELWFEREPYDPEAPYEENVRKGISNTIKAIAEAPALAIKFPAQIAREVIGEPIRRKIESDLPQVEGVVQPEKKKGLVADIGESFVGQVKMLAEMAVSGIPGADPMWAENLFESPDLVVFGKILARDAARKAYKSAKSLQRPDLKPKLDIDEALRNPEAPPEQRRLAGMIIGSRMRADKKLMSDWASQRRWDEYVTEQIKEKKPIDPVEFDAQNDLLRDAIVGALDIKQSPIKPSVIIGGERKVGEVGQAHEELGFADIKVEGAEKGFDVAGTHLSPEETIRYIEARPGLFKNLPDEVKSGEREISAADVKDIYEKQAVEIAEKGKQKLLEPEKIKEEVIGEEIEFARIPRTLREGGHEDRLAAAEALGERHAKTSEGAFGRITAEETAFREHAKETKTLIPEEPFNEIFAKQTLDNGGMAYRGAEHEAIVDHASGKIIKRRFWKIRRIADYLWRIRNSVHVSPLAPMRLLGWMDFTKKNGEKQLMPVTEQTFIVGKKTTQIKIDEHMNAMGWAGDTGTYKNHKLGLKVTDVHTGNVIELPNSLIVPFDFFLDEIPKSEVREPVAKPPKFVRKASELKWVKEDKMYDAFYRPTAAPETFEAFVKEDKILGKSFYHRSKIDEKPLKFDTVQKAKNHLFREYKRLVHPKAQFELAAKEAKAIKKKPTIEELKVEETIKRILKGKPEVKVTEIDVAKLKSEGLTIKEIADKITEAAEISKVKVGEAVVGGKVVKLEKVEVPRKTEAEYLKMAREKKAKTLTPKEVEAIKENKKLEESGKPKVEAKLYEGMVPGTREWARLWKERPEFQKEMIKYAKSVTEGKEIRPGPGAKTADALPEHPTDIEQLTQAMLSNLKGNETFEQRLTLGEKIADKMSGAKTAPTKAIEGLKGLWVAMKQNYLEPNKWTNFKEILGNKQLDDTKAGFRIKDFAIKFTKQFPDKLKREALFNYIEAGGDAAYIRDAAKFTIEKYKRGWLEALKLTPQEKLLADNIRQYFDAQLEEAIRRGVLKDGVENYIMRIVKPGSKSFEKFKNESRSGLWKKDPSFIKRRIYETILEGERAGKVYIKDAGQSIAMYSQAMARALSTRKMVEDFTTNGVGSDGRPLGIIGGGIIPVMEGDVAKAFVINPKIHPDKVIKDELGHKINIDTSDYRFIDHGAFRGIRFIGKGKEGKPMLLQGDILVHPEVYSHLKNILSPSLVRQKALGRGILAAAREFKSTLLSMSGFHQVQEAVHAAFHAVAPWKLPELDMNNKTQAELVKHGLKIFDYDAMENFAEGLAGTGLIQRMPYVGGLFQKYNHYLFTDYIPRLKTKMAMAALQRNFERYTGKLGRDEIIERTASQANAAFGELNYEMLGRNRTFQDILRLMTLAPDFLEARTRFMVQALRPYGREQFIALFMRGALGMYVGARIANKILDDDYHFDHPFGVVIGGREFTLRSVPGDMYHLFRDPRSFVYHRLNPTIMRTFIEAVTGRDYLGRKRDFVDEVKDFITTHAPIPLQSQVDKAFGIGVDRKLWESAMNSIGMTSWEYKSAAEQKARKLIQNRGPFVYSERSRKVNNMLRKIDREELTMDDIQKALSDGEITKFDYKKILKEHKKPMIRRAIQHLGAEDLIDIWDSMTDEEKRLTKRDIRKKIHNKLPKMLKSEKQPLRDFLKEIQEFEQKDRGGM